MQFVIVLTLPCASALWAKDGYNTHKDYIMFIYEKKSMACYPQISKWVQFWYDFWFEHELATYHTSFLHRTPNYVTLNCYT